MAVRFPMRIDPVWRPMLFPLGGTREASFAEVTDDSVRFQFGLLFDRTFPLSDVAGARNRDAHWWHGIGWRSNLLGQIGLLGSHSGVVEVRFKTRTRALGVFPCDSVAISLQDPDGFLAALKGAK
ncbi:MAG: hypothetical protein M3O21_02165 [Chloroflexota bacterium]|nr:hypothetical protein [Chloroflexota bacterium]